MATFKCKECGNEQEGAPGMPPHSCKQCKAKGAIWTVTASGGGSPGKKSPTKNPVKPLGGSATQQKLTEAKPPTKVGGARLPTPNPTGGMPAPTKSKTEPPPKKPPTPVMEPIKQPGPATPPPPVATASPPVHEPTAAPPPAPPVPQQPQVESQPAPPPPVTRAPPDHDGVQQLSERVVWVFPDSVAADADAQRNCPALDGSGRAYFAIANKVVAFDDRNGDLKIAWSYDTGGRILGSPVLGSDGNLRVHSEDAHLHIISKDGKRVGTPARIGEPLGWATPLVDSQNVTWICGYHGGLFKVDAEGKIADSVYFRGKQRFDCTGVIHDGVLYVGAENACVYAILLGESRGTNVWDHLNEEGRTGWFINSALALAGGPTLVVASRDDCLYGFQLDGKKRWSVEVNGQMLGSPIIDADDSVYVGLSLIEGREEPRGALVRIDGVSHKVRWRYDTEAPIESTPVLADDGTIYFGDNDGFIHALNADGKQIWTERVAAGVRSPGTILEGGKVVFGLENGQFVALSCQSQSVRPGAWAKFLGNASQTGVATT